MPKRAAKRAPQIFQLRVELRRVRPAVWRRVLVPASVTLAVLHETLNEVMGWTNSHLHQFVVGTRRFGDLTMPDVEEDPDLEDERKVRLDQLLMAGQGMVYEYDFGDGWDHDVVVEAILPVDDRFAYPVCVAGERACPPEDCGGDAGYAHLVAVLAGEGRRPSQERDDLLRWVGGHFDPAGFDVNRTNAALRGRVA